jgi:hypothetical protein
VAIAGILGTGVFIGETQRGTIIPTNDDARARVLEAFFGETEGNDSVLPVARPQSSEVTDEEDPSEEISNDVEWLVRTKASPPEPVRVLNLRKLENFGDFVGSCAIELTSLMVSVPGKPDEWEILRI